MNRLPNTFALLSPTNINRIYFFENLGPDYTYYDMRHIQLQGLTGRVLTTPLRLDHRIPEGFFRIRETIEISDGRSGEVAIVDFATTPFLINRIPILFLINPIIDPIDLVVKREEASSIKVGRVSERDDLYIPLMDFLRRHFYTLIMNARTEDRYPEAPILIQEDFLFSEEETPILIPNIPTAPTIPTVPSEKTALALATYAIQQKEVCPISLEPIHAGEVTVTGCLCVFQTAGFSKYKGNTCPTCRSPLVKRIVKCLG